ncbi:TPA: LPXTG cell wall anchor domain-containing protein, partial [Streptococcus equi subsp. zooepidemicus]|nr:LPXTG cell wall anchor domain-containing protein [Streptococcus equi subsp. zooepidemicus]HEL0441671.1 LPXTG cell wall anchor domain-containing protein [Streptococcus equi subsp. zooepidemicus]
EKGDQGQKGEKGDQGQKGEKGDQGIQGQGEHGHKGHHGKDAKPSAPKADSKSTAKAMAPAAQKGTLPATGETNHPFFTLAALGVIASAGMLTLKGKKN